MSEVVGKMSAEEMLARLDAITGEEPDPVDDALTILEWAAKLKVCRIRLSPKIRAAVEAGEMERVKRRRRTAAGWLKVVDCYRWVK